MERPWGFGLFLAGMLAWNLLIFATPLAVQSDAPDLYQPSYLAFSFTCHQLDSRSLCYYPEGGNPIGDCLPQNGIERYGKNIWVLDPSTGRMGIKIPVCARDVGIYGSMLIAALAWLAVYRNDLRREAWPNRLWLFLALIPIALDGGGQLLGFWESTNLVRLITGAIAGTAITFYLIPVLNQLFNPFLDELMARWRKR